MVGFVDGTSGSINVFLSPKLHEPEYYINLAIHDTQLWNSILSLSGGALQAAKCLYHLLYFDFTSIGIPYLRGGHISPMLQIIFKQATSPTPLQNLTAYTSLKALGIHKVPAGQSTKQIDTLIRKSQHYSKDLSTNYLSPTEAWIFYNTIYLPSITYPFLSLTISQQDCYLIQKQIKAPLLQKCGYNRNSLTTVIYSSQAHRGSGLHPLYVDYSMSCIKAFMTSLHSTGTLSQLAWIALAWAQHVASTSILILEGTSTKRPHLAPIQWIPNLCKILNKNSTTINTHNYCINPQ